MIIISMYKTSYLIYFCVMVLRCLWGFHSVHGIQQIPVNFYYKGKYTSDIKNYEIVFPQRVNKDGSFISHLVQHRHSKRSTTEKEYVFYKIPIGGKDYLIELTPNRKLIAPGAVVEIRKEVTKKSSKRKVFNDINPNETLREMFENLEIRKLENTECHFSGHVKGENISKAALSTCYGLAGFIEIKNGFYTIEPVAEHDPSAEDSYPHILYKEDGLENSTTCHTIRDMATALLDQVVRKRRESYIGLTSPMFAETLIVVDKTMINHHGESDCENYVLTVFNMAHNLFRDASVGMLMTLTVVRLIRLEIEDDEMNLKVDKDAEKTLKYFQTWQYEINPGDDSHPNHHDLALLLTRVNVCSSPTPCTILGLTTIGKACDPKQSAALCEDSGLRLGYVIAHEIGHLLGADHDAENSTCNGTLEGGLKTVMHPQVSVESKAWSKCSQDYFKEFFKTTENCFLDEPEEHYYNMPDLPPGVMYNADFQCRYLFTPKARECDIGSTCSSLNCYIPGYACIISHMQPADGTHCGESMWCHNSKCLVVGERPGAVDGNWGEWSAWSDCSRTCGSGVANSVRNCDKPQPAHGGKNCVDLIRFISEEVNVSFVGKPCETGRPSFRDIQCGEFNDWIYPEDGKSHTWKAHYFHEDNPCVLYCINEDKVVAALRPRVIDGTTCYRGGRDVCVAGNCKSLPCDLQFGSNAVEDACGVCHGDGTSCEFTQGIRTLTKLPKGFTKLLTIPTGTKNIKVEETTPSRCKFFLRDKDTKDAFAKGKSLGVFSVSGTQAWLGMINRNQEALNIPGPITKPLTVWINRPENVTVKWSMALPAEQQRKPEFAWDYLKWGPCSAKCGPGVQKSEPSCMEEKAGLVEDSYCSELQMPPVKVKPCEIEKCFTRWMVGDWKDCDNPDLQGKIRKRAVYCIKKIGEGEGESQIVPDSECTEPKPHSKEPCEKRQKREDTEYNREEDSGYKSETSEFALHKKYDDYLKHFSALSVPQKKSETIPFHLVSSPHFRHYFHVLETPDDNSEEQEKGDELNLGSADNLTDQIENKVSSDFYKDTFSGQQVDVSHFANKLSVKEKKSVFFNNPKRKRGTKRKKNVHEMDGKLQKRGQNHPKRGNKRSIRRRSSFLSQSPNYLPKLLQNKKPIRRRHLDDKTNEISISNLVKSDAIRKLFPRVRETRNVTPRKKRRKSPRATSEYWILSPGKNRIDDMRRKKFLPFNYEERPEKPKKEKRKGRRREHLRKLGNGVLIRQLNTEWNLSPDIFRKIRKHEKHARRLKDESEYPIVVLEAPSEPTFKNRFRDFFVWKKNPQTPLKSSYEGEKRSQYTLVNGKLNKSKRSNRKRKKSKLKDIGAKLSKENLGNVYGIDTKNYLNNLFREARPKITTNKPVKTVQAVKKPVIHAGKVIIDRDSIEDKQVDILFQNDEDGEKGEKNLSQLPRPPVNKNTLCLKNQQVFDLIQTLQRRSCFYRHNNNNNNHNYNTNTNNNINNIDHRKMEIGVNFTNEKKRAPIEHITEHIERSIKPDVTSVMDCYDEALECYSKQKIGLPPASKVITKKPELPLWPSVTEEDVTGPTIFVAIKSQTSLPLWDQCQYTTTPTPGEQWCSTPTPSWEQYQATTPCETTPVRTPCPPVRPLPPMARFPLSTSSPPCPLSRNTLPSCPPSTIRTSSNCQQSQSPSSPRFQLTTASPLCPPSTSASYTPCPSSMSTSPRCPPSSLPYFPKSTFPSCESSPITTLPSCPPSNFGNFQKTTTCEPWPFTVLPPCVTPSLPPWAQSQKTSTGSNGSGTGTTGSPNCLQPPVPIAIPFCPELLTTTTTTASSSSETTATPTCSKTTETSTTCSKTTETSATCSKATETSATCSITKPLSTTPATTTPNESTTTSSTKPTETTTISSTMSDTTTTTSTTISTTTTSSTMTDTTTTTATSTNTNSMSDATSTTATSVTTDTTATISTPTSTTGSEASGSTTNTTSTSTTITSTTIKPNSTETTSSTKISTALPICTQSSTASPICTQSSTASPTCTQSTTGSPTCTQSTTGSPTCTQSTTGSPMCTQSSTTASPMCTQSTTSASSICTQPTTGSSMCTQPTTTASPMCTQPTATKSPICTQPTKTASTICAQSSTTPSSICEQSSTPLPICEQSSTTPLPICIPGPIFVEGGQLPMKASIQNWAQYPIESLHTVLEPQISTSFQTEPEVPLVTRDKSSLQNQEEYSLQMQEQSQIAPPAETTVQTQTDQSFKVKLGTNDSNSDVEVYYDIDEIIPLPNELEFTTEVETKLMKKEKKKKKLKEELQMEREKEKERKNKAENKGPYLEDYEEDLEEHLESNATKTVYCDEEEKPKKKDKKSDNDDEDV